MRYTEREVLQFVDENDVKFVKLMFCDVFGNLKAISVLSSELPKIFKQGYAFDATQMDGFMAFTKQIWCCAPCSTPFRCCLGGRSRAEL